MCTTFQTCKSSLYRNRAKTTQELPTLQEETLMVHRLHISWRKVPPPWRHWCPGTQNPDILNGFKHSTFVCSGDSVYWWNFLLVYQILYTAIHPACQCQWNHVSPRLWAFTEQEWDDIHSFLCVIEGCSTWSAVCVNAWTQVTGLRIRCKKRCAHQLPWNNNQMQCLWRKVQSCGLTVQFREDDGFHHLVRTTVLTLVPEHQVDVWLEVGCVAFKDYVTDTLVEGHLMI